MSEALFQNAQRHHQAGDLAQAARLYTEVLRGHPMHLGALQMLGFLHFQRDEFAAAESLLARALAINPRDVDALYNRGCALQSLERHSEALKCFDAALGLEPGDPGALHGRGRALQGLGRTDEALACFERVIRLEPASIEALIDKAIALVALARVEEALVPLGAALRVDPRDGAALVNRANALIHLKRHAEALTDADAALALNPSHAEAWHNRASALTGLKRFPETLAAYDKALAIKPGNASTWNNRGNALIGLKRYEDALADFDRSLAMSPADIETRANRANALSHLKRYGEAIAECEAALRANPDHALSLNVAVHCRMHACDWRGYESFRRRAIGGLMAGRRTVSPFDAKGFVNSEEENLQAARLWVEAECPPMAPLYRGERYAHDKIRIAYISTDLRSHAVAYLIVGVFEHHDKSRFETTAISLGPDDRSETRAHIVGAFDRFIDARDKNDGEVAALLRSLEIDIAIDLNGYTGDGRPRILAQRPAPVQVNYLGFPGTMGADFIDYVIADHIIVPEASEPCYSERVVRLPYSYQPNGRYASNGAAPTRAGAGLPENGFVFCSFNNNYKIAPAMFDIWMRLLREVPGRVLWLLEDNSYATANLAREAEVRGVAATRLVFTPRVSPADHLVRQTLADLFLDTLPYNAHTTASDALWMGLPLITCPGQSFQGRVAASLLTAAGMPELVVDTLVRYEQMALILARSPPILAAVKAKLAGNRGTCALFDIERTARHLEAAYTTMHERHARGLPPEAFAFPP